MFLFDGSSSIKPQANCLRCKQFVKDIILKFNISLTESHVGVVQYASNADIVFGLNKYSSNAEVNQAIDDFRQKRGSTNMNEALTVVKDQAFGAVPARPNVSRILIVMTDGPISEDLKPLSLELQKNVTVFALGIGQNYNPTKLNDMASDPNGNHAYKTGFLQLSSVATLIRDKACPGDFAYRDKDRKKERNHAPINSLL